MDSSDRELEELWAEILSEDAVRVTSAVARLPEEERVAILRHLRGMVEAEGWTEGQRRRARAALRALSVA
jgi:hypothetical protein